jgi:hypothetical protein
MPPAVELTEAQCREWLENPTRNPQTRARIDPQARRGRFDEIYRYCEERFDLAMDPARFRQLTGVSPSVTAPRTRTTRRTARPPPRVHVFPETDAQWATFIETYAPKIYHWAQFDFNIRSAWADANSILILSRTRFPPQFKEQLDGMWNVLTAHISNTPTRADTRNRVANVESEFAHVAQAALTTQGDQTLATRINTLLFCIESHLYFGDTQPRVGRLSYGALQSLTEMLVSRLMLVHLEPAQNEGIPALPDSRSRSSPTSMSSSRDDRSFSASYKRHSKLSAVSPWANPDASPMPERTRQQLLKELKAACTEMRDAISYESFARMPKKQLQLIVRIGKTGQQRCYYVRNIYNQWRAAEEANKPFVDPLSRVPVTTEEKDDIMKKVRYIAPNAADPRKKQAKKEKEILLEVVTEQGRDPQGRAHNFFRLRVLQKLGRWSTVVFSLGHVPADIEPQDMGGALNLSSAVILANIQRLFDMDRLLIRNQIPYSCCRIHLRKPMAYWYDPNGPKGISAHRMRLMAEEVEQYLA